MILCTNYNVMLEIIHLLVSYTGLRILFKRSLSAIVRCMGGPFGTKIFVPQYGG